MGIQVIPIRPCPRSVPNYSAKRAPLFGFEDTSTCSWAFTLTTFTLERETAPSANSRVKKWTTGGLLDRTVG